MSTVHEPTLVYGRPAQTLEQNLYLCANDSIQYGLLGFPGKEDSYTCVCVISLRDEHPIAPRIIGLVNSVPQQSIRIVYDWNWSMIIPPQQPAHLFLDLQFTIPFQAVIRTSFPNDLARPFLFSVTQKAPMNIGIATRETIARGLTPIVFERIHTHPSLMAMADMLLATSSDGYKARRSLVHAA